jgi:hypothetical protein
MAKSAEQKKKDAKAAVKNKITIPKITINPKGLLKSILILRKKQAAAADLKIKKKKK